MKCVGHTKSWPACQFAAVAVANVMHSACSNSTDISLCLGVDRDKAEVVCRHLVVDLDTVS